MLDGVPLRVFVRCRGPCLDAFDLGVVHAERTQIVHEDERLTFAEVRARSLALACEAAVVVRRPAGRPGRDPGAATSPSS